MAPDEWCGEEGTEHCRDMPREVGAHLFLHTGKLSKRLTLDAHRVGSRVQQILCKPTALKSNIWGPRWWITDSDRMKRQRNCCKRDLQYQADKRYVVLGYSDQITFPMDIKKNGRNVSVKVPAYEQAGRHQREEKKDRMRIVYRACGF